MFKKRVAWSGIRPANIFQTTPWVKICFQVRQAIAINRLVVTSVQLSQNSYDFVNYKSEFRYKYEPSANGYIPHSSMRSYSQPGFFAHSEGQTRVHLI